MKPSLITLPEITLMGAEVHFIGALSPDANNMAVITAHWTEFYKRKKEVGKTLDDFAYGAVKQTAEKHKRRPGELIYLASFSVKPDARVPLGMVKWAIRKQDYALFIHKGPVSRLSDTISYIHRVWLPRSKFRLDDSPELERFDDRYQPGSSSSEIEFLVPVRPKSG